MKPWDATELDFNAATFSGVARLFPLPNLVLYPHVMQPLHIFEERYQAMFAHCREHESEFGIVLADDDGPHEVGCACTIEEVLEHAPDGRMNVLNRGTRPFRVQAWRADLPFPAGTVEFLDDEVEEGDAEAATEARAIYARLIDAATEHEPDEDAIAAMDAYAMAGTVDFGIDAKQRLLELRSENARMALLTRLLRAALKRLDYSDRAEARARSNGKVRFGE